VSDRNSDHSWRCNSKARWCGLQHKDYLAREKKREERQFAKLSSRRRCFRWWLASRRRVSPAVGLATAAPAAGILVARGNGEGSRALEKEEKRDVVPVSGGRRHRRRPWSARMGAALMMVVVDLGFVRERELGKLVVSVLRRKELGLPPFLSSSTPFQFYWICFLRAPLFSISASPLSMWHAVYFFFVQHPVLLSFLGLFSFFTSRTFNSFLSPSFALETSFHTSIIANLAPHVFAGLVLGLIVFAICTTIFTIYTFLVFLLYFHLLLTAPHLLMNTPHLLHASRTLLMHPHCFSLLSFLNKFHLFNLFS